MKGWCKPEVNCLLKSGIITVNKRNENYHFVFSYIVPSWWAVWKMNKVTGSEGKCVSAFQEKKVLFNRAVMLIKLLTIISKYNKAHCIYMLCTRLYTSKAMFLWFASSLNFFPVRFHLYIAFWSMDNFIWKWALLSSVYLK